MTQPRLTQSTVPPHVIGVVPSDAHLELALRDGLPPSMLPTGTANAMVTWARLKQDLVEAMLGRRLAPRCASSQATLAALIEHAAEAPFAVPTDPASQIALSRALDTSVGHLRRAAALDHAQPSEASAQLVFLRRLAQNVDERFAAAGWLDARGAGVALAKVIASADQAWPLPSNVVLLSGLLPADADDLVLLEAIHTRLRERGGGLSVALPRLEQTSPFSMDDFDKVIDALERRWAGLANPPEIHWVETQGGQVDAVLDAADPLAEAREIVGRIRRDAAPWEHTAIAVTDLRDATLDPLRETLNAAGIPFAEPRGRSARASPEARAILTLLDLAAGPIDRDGVISLLRTPGLHPGFWTGARDERDATFRATQLAHRLREVPVVRTTDPKLFVEEVRRRTRTDEAWMAGALERMLESVQWIGAATTRVALADRMLRTFDLLKLGRPSAFEIGQALSTGSAASLAIMGEGSAALRAVRRIVTELRDTARELSLGHVPMSISGLRAELLSELEAATTRPPGAAVRAGAVRVDVASRLAGLPFKRLYMTGIRAAGADATLDELAGAEQSEALPAERRAYREAMLAWACGSAARVVLSRAAPEAGQEPEPLPRALQRAVAAGAALSHPAASRLRAPATRRDHWLVELANATAQADVDIARRTRRLRDHEAFFADVASRSALTETDASLASHLVACVGGDTACHPVAVTTIERIARCHFAGFASSVLRARRVDDVDESASARERGTLVHRALQAMFESVDRGGGPGIEERALEAARKALGIGRPTTPLRREAMEQALREALAVLRDDLESADDGLRRWVIEKSFGAGRESPFGPLELPGDPVVFVDGQIDRVDATADRRRLRVVDYKTGRIQASDLGRTALQLPLYAEVVSRVGAEQVDVMYVRVRPGGKVERWPKKNRADGTWSAEERAVAMSSAHAAVIALYKGEIAPRPARPTYCARCEARDICRRPAVVPLEDGAEGDDG